jgi:hypothetical protein
MQGCDASVLLDPTPANPETEKTAPINIGLAAFDVIDDIKAALEERCPGTVSCADILVYAARDASSILSNGRVRFAAPAGRLDGVVSRAADAQRDLPDSTFTVAELVRNFRRKNFTVEELVILSGAHASVPGPAVGQVRRGGARSRPRGAQQRARRGPARRGGCVPALPRQAAPDQGLVGQQLLPQQPGAGSHL